MTQPLFMKERFQMHSGGFSDFKIECDALGEDDYKTLAFLVSRKISFREVYGIPRGGVPFEKALRPYADPSSETFLIADDVVTTGGSFLRARKDLAAMGRLAGFQVCGVAVFARGAVLPWVQVLFTLDPLFWQND